MAAGEFPALNEAQATIAREHGQPSWVALKRLIRGQSQPESHALAQLRWIIALFRDVGEPGWTVPGDHEMRQHFDDSFLAEVPAAELIAEIIRVAPDLREDLVVIGQAPLTARAQIASLEVRAAVAAG